MSPDVLLYSLGYGLVFVLLTINGIISVPSSQIIYLIAGVLVARGNLEFLPLILAGGLGNALGNLITYGLIYKYGESIIEKFFLVKHAHVKAFQEKVNLSGVWLLFVGKLTPSIKVNSTCCCWSCKNSPANGNYSFHHHICCVGFYLRGSWLLFWKSNYDD